jgi:hypothetical protein
MLPPPRDSRNPPKLGGDSGAKLLTRGEAWRIAGYTMQLWPYDDPAKSPPLPLTWDERLVAAWDWIVPKTSSQLAAKEEPEGRKDGR